MAMGEIEPLEGQPGCAKAGKAREVPCSSPEPGDDYFSSGSFSPVTVQFGDEAEAPETEPEGSQRRAPDSSSDDSPQVIVQFGEDPGFVPRDDPEED
jgi:hypothetical protein